MCGRRPTASRPRRRARSASLARRRAVAGGPCGRRRRSSRRCRAVPGWPWPVGSRSATAMDRRSAAAVGSVVGSGVACSVAGASVADAPGEAEPAAVTARVADGDPVRAEVAAAATSDGVRPEPPSRPKPATSAAMTSTVAAPRRTGVTDERRASGPAIGRAALAPVDGRRGVGSVGMTVRRYAERPQARRREPVRAVRPSTPGSRGHDRICPLLAPPPTCCARSG